MVLFYVIFDSIQKRDSTQLLKFYWHRYTLCFHMMT